MYPHTYTAYLGQHHQQDKHQWDLCIPWTYLNHLTQIPYTGPVGVKMYRKTCLTEKKAAVTNNC